MNLIVLDPVTIVSVIIILVASVYFGNKIYVYKRDGKLIENRRYIEQRPTVASTLGVLGTFLGITIGLIHFNTNDINGSIPLLLDGLKTAFFTSLAGMICSLILSWYVDHVYDEYDEDLKKKEDKEKVDNINQAAGMIVHAVNELVQQSKSDGETIKNSIDALNVSLTTSTNAVNEIKNKQDSNHTAICQALEQSNSDIVNCLKINQSILSGVRQGTTTIANAMEPLNNEVKAVSTTLEKEVIDIENKMSNTNQLLTNKFDEFSELLKKSNTEALVEVMKKVTEEFQKQMNELIGRLVKENFDKLNQSVEQLTTWQVENKEMIASLTSQYKRMEEEFEATSGTLTKVGDDTKMLVSDGSKLQKLITTLNSVMVEDEKFIQITSNLTATSDLAKENMEAFKESTDKLNDWVRKQRNFVEAVQQLLEKLEEICKLKDYSDEFWKGTKKGLLDSMVSIQNASSTLNGQLTNLDQKFYSRLSATLSELDTCIQAMVKGRG